MLIINGANQNQIDIFSCELFENNYLINVNILGNNKHVSQKLLRPKFYCLQCHMKKKTLFTFHIYDEKKTQLC